MRRLRDEFAKKVRRKATALQDIRQVVEDKLALMLRSNPQRMDYYKRYSEIVADYNREKDRVTIEETFAKLVDLANSLDAEQRRAVEEGLSEEELAVFDLLKKDTLSKADRERLKDVSKELLAELLAADRPAGALDGEGANPSGSGGLHPRPSLPGSADPTVHSRRQAGDCQAGLSPCLAAKCKRAFSTFVSS